MILEALLADNLVISKLITNISHFWPNAESSEYLVRSDVEFDAIGGTTLDSYFFNR